MSICLQEEGRRGGAHAARWSRSRRRELLLRTFFKTLFSVILSTVLEKEMATHSCIPAWRIPWPEEPSGLQSMGPQGDTTELTLTINISTA